MSTAAAATQWPFGLPVWLRSTSALLSRPLTPACAPDRRATQPGVVQLAVVAVTQQRQAVDDDGLQAGIAVGVADHPQRPGEGLRVGAAVDPHQRAHRGDRTVALVLGDA